MKIDLIAEQAKKEIEEEEFRIEVEKLKSKLRQKRRLWDMVFPWKISIKRKENKND